MRGALGGENNTQFVWCNLKIGWSRQVGLDKRAPFIGSAAAQPSHDWAAREPMTDFSVTS